jgi:hypothetical protein
MILQLSNGKIIHLTVEEYLSLSDEDIQYLNSVNVGNETPNNPFHGSVIKNPRIREEKSYDDYLDYTPDDEDNLTPPNNNINIDDLIDPDTL